MNEQKVQELLQRYFDGATSLEEERYLKRYFACDKIHDSLKAYRPMFTFFAQELAIEPPQRKTKARKIRLNMSIITALAASIAILLWIGLVEMKSDNYVYFVNGQRVYDESAAIALAETKLQLLASSMQNARNGMSALYKLQESNQSLQQFGKISDVYRQIEEIGSKLEEFKMEN